MANDTESASNNRYASTGISGLDIVMHGFRRGGMFLIEGDSGAGKTMLALAFATDGAANGEPVVYVTLSETRRELEAIAEVHSWDLSRIHIIEGGREGPKYTLFHPSEVELEEAIKQLKEQIEQIKPTRVVIDSLAEIRLMTQSSLRYRRELMDLKRFLSALNCTTLMLDQSGADDTPRSLVDGSVVLEQLAPDYGGERRRLRVPKYRGHSYSGGYHDFLIRKGGLEVFPRLVAAEHRTERKSEVLSSGTAELDAMFGGGVTLGSSTLLMGPAGTGKSSIGLLFAVSAAARGSRAAIYLFDERPELMMRRAEGLGMDLSGQVAAGRVLIKQIDPVELSPGQFAQSIRDEVEHQGTAVLVIDSLNGYFHAMPDERFLVAQMHELLTYLGQQGVSSFIVMGQTGLIGEETPANTSYLTDNILLLRFFESRGEFRRSIAVIKKRGGPHEQTIRELNFGPQGIHIGEPLRQFQGVLTGTPVFTGATNQLLEPEHGKRKRE